MKDKPNDYYPAGTDLQYKPTTHEEERALFIRARAGDEEAKEFLIRNHLLFAVIQGRQWAKGQLRDDDVISAANFGLMLAYQDFDHTRDNRFSSYIVPFIRGEIAKLFRQQNTMGDRRKNFPSKARVTSEEFSAITTKQVPMEPESENFGLIVSETPGGEEHQNYLLELLEKSKGVLTDLEAEIIRRHFGEKAECLSDIGDEKGLTRSRIHQLKDSAIRKLRRELSKRMRASNVSR